MKLKKIVKVIKMKNKIWLCNALKTFTLVDVFKHLYKGG